MKKFSIFLAVSLAATAAASCSSRKARLATAQEILQGEIFVQPGPYQFCAAVNLMLAEAPDAFPSFRGQILESQKIYATKCSNGFARDIYAAQPIPWANLTGCQIENSVFETNSDLQFYSSYYCEDGTDWKDPDYLFRMMKESLHVCFYGQYELEEDEHSITMKKPSGHGEPFVKLEIAYYSELSPPDKHLFFTLESYTPEDPQ